MSEGANDHGLTAQYGDHVTSESEGVNDLLLPTIQELIQTSSRETAEETVCERLAESTLYQFAWIGERELDGHQVVPRVAAGEDHGLLDAVGRQDERTAGLLPASRAIRTGDVQVVTVDDSMVESWREAADVHGCKSVAAVPLCHAETTYGVLVVFTTRADAFDERERTWFDVIGRAVGSVIHAARSRELLFADEIVELEFRVTDPDALFVRFAADAGCRLELDGYVPSGKRWLLYVGVDGTPPAAVVDAAAQDGRVERSRVISENDDPRVELVVVESSVLHTVTAAGATVRTITADSNGARIVVEAPVDMDVREVVDLLQNDYSGAEFVARSDHDRAATTVGRPEGLLDELTDRQREALGAAYRAGYFTWPRGSTAEEVAVALDIAPSTLHGHLRKAEAVILGALLDDSSRR